MYEPGKVQVLTLGSGGVYIRWGDDAILIGPAASNPSLLRAAFGYLRFDEVQIGKYRLTFYPGASR